MRARLRVLRADHHELLALAFDLVRLVGVAGIEEAVALRRDDVERIALGELRVGGGALARRHIARQRIDVLARLHLLVHHAERRRDEVLGVLDQELDLARRRRELAFGMRQPVVGRADGEMEIAVLAEIVHVDARHLRRVPLHVMLGELHVAHLELRIVEAHAAASSRKISAFDLASPHGSIACSLMVR